MLCEIHGVLLSGGRGSGKLPGELRRSQNWIGGTRRGNALFVPPPVDYLMDCLSDLELFLHDTTFPVLIKAGLVHAQFETIHPFLDGNGRLGRLLITLLLCHSGMLDAPILYLSLYLKQHRSQYYELLQEVRLQGSWEIWLEFFLDGVYQSAKAGVQTTHAITQLFEIDIMKIAALGRIRFSCEPIFNYLKQLPQVTVPLLVRELGLSAPTVRSALNQMVAVGVLEVNSNIKRNKVYVYRQYLDLLEAGTEPF